MITLTPATGTAAHPKIKDAQPALQVQAAGPGKYTWRVFDQAASGGRAHLAYAAGHVGFPADATQEEIDRAHHAARAEATAALAEVRRMLRRA